MNTQKIINMMDVKRTYPVGAVRKDGKATASVFIRARSKPKAVKEAIDLFGSDYRIHVYDSE